MRTCEEQAYVTICKRLGTLKIPPAVVKCVRKSTSCEKTKASSVPSGVDGFYRYLQVWCTRKQQAKEEKKNMLRSTLKSPRTGRIWRLLDPLNPLASRMQAT